MRTWFRSSGLALIVLPLLGCGSVVGIPIGDASPDGDSDGDGDGDGDGDADGDADGDVDSDADRDGDGDGLLEAGTCEPAEPEVTASEPLWIEDAVVFDDGSFALFAAVDGRATFGDGAATIETSERELVIARFSRDAELQWLERIRAGDSDVWDFSPGDRYCTETGFYCCTDEIQPHVPALALSDGSLLLNVSQHWVSLETVVLGVGSPDEETLELSDDGSGYWVKYLPSGERQYVLPTWDWPLYSTDDSGWIASYSYDFVAQPVAMSAVERFDSNGELRWSRTVSESSPYFFHVHDGSIVVFGDEHDLPELDPALVPDGCDAERDGEVNFAARIGADGEVIWSRCLGYRWDIAALVVTDDGGVAVVGLFDAADVAAGISFGTGETEMVPEGIDSQGVLLARFDADGSPEWVTQAAAFSDDYVDQGDNWAWWRGVTYTLREDGTALIRESEDTASFGEGERQVSVREGTLPATAMGSFDQSGELAWVEYQSDSFPGLFDTRGPDIIIGTAEYGRPYVLIEGTDGIVVPSTGANADLVLAALDGDGEPQWSQRIGGGGLYEVLPPLRDHGATLAFELHRGRSTFGSGPAAATVGAEGLVVIGAGRFESDGSMAWAAPLVSAHDPCARWTGEHLFACPDSIETASDAEPYTGWWQYDRAVDAVRRQALEWADPSCFRLCDSPGPGELCWVADCATADGAVIEGAGSTVESVEGSDPARQSVIRETQTLTVSPPARTASWASIELRDSSTYSCALEDWDGHCDSSRQQNVGWVGTVDPCWPTSYDFEFEMTYVYTRTPSYVTSFTHDQCSIELDENSDFRDDTYRVTVNGHGADCVDGVCTVF
jgi:hypothetical protein